MESTETRWQRHVDQGRLYVSQGNYAEAEQSLLAAVKEALTLGPADLRVASSLGILGKLKHRQGDRERARGFLERALAVREEALGPDHYGVVQGLNDLAALHYACGQLAEARSLYERALAISEKQLAPGHSDIALALYNLSRVYFKSGDHLRAEPLLTRLLEIKERTLGADHTDVAAILAALSRVRSMAGRHDEAEAMARRALDIRERSLSPDDPAIAVSLELVAYFCAGRSKRMRSLADAERILRGSCAASDDAESSGESGDTPLESELALLAAEEKALRERAREIRSRAGGHREPNTLERSPAPVEERREVTVAPPERDVPQARTAVEERELVVEPELVREAEPVTEVESVSKVESVAEGESVAEMEAVSQVETVAEQECIPEAEAGSDTASVSEPEIEGPSVLEYIPAVIVPSRESEPESGSESESEAEGEAEAAERVERVEERPRTRGAALPRIFQGRRGRWLFGLAALALLVAGAAGYALGRGTGAPDAAPVVTLQQSSRGAIEEPQADSLQPAGPVDAPPPAAAAAAPSPRHAATPRIPDWDRSPKRTRRATRIPSRLQARRMTRTMERLGTKMMAGVEMKVDSLSRTVELPPPTFDKP